MFSVYSVCFWVGLLFTVLSAFGSHLFGGGHDVHSGDVGTGGHADAGFEHTGMPGISFFSPTTIASFLTAFGGFGMIFSRFEMTAKPMISAPLAAVAGLMVAGAVFWGFNSFFSKTQSSSESRVSSLIGQQATVISPIPENGVGEIAYVQAGSRYTAPARAESGQAITAGRPVKITRTVASQFFVTPIV
jgi:membrane protein implicated in regulation of membrane protease activity